MKIRIMIFLSALSAFCTFGMDLIPRGGIHYSTMSSTQVSSGNMVISPDGRFLYATAWIPCSDNCGNIIRYARDTVSGELTYLDLFHGSGDSTLGEIARIAMSPDGNFMYATT